MSRSRVVKRLFDLCLSTLLILFLSVPILFLFLLSALDTKLNGFFIQRRVGRYAKTFYILKIRTLNKRGEVSYFGKFLRDNKLDELPQIFNIFIGNMSFVGPRPDVLGSENKLSEDQFNNLLRYKPGLTSPASIIYSKEEIILSNVKNSKQYYDDIIWPHKTKLNLIYFKNQTFLRDIKIIMKTISCVFFKRRVDVESFIQE